MPAIGHHDAHARPVQRGPDVDRARRPPRCAVAGRRPVAIGPIALEHRVAGVRQHVDQRLPQAVAVGVDLDRIAAGARRGSPVRADWRRRHWRRRAPGARRPRRSIVEANRPRVVEHVVDQPIEAGDFTFDVVDGADGGRVARTSAAAQRAQRRLDDHQRDCESRAPAPSRAGRARTGARAALPRAGTAPATRSASWNALVSSRASSSSQRVTRGAGAGGRQIAGGRNLAHRRRQGADRPRDHPGHGVAEERGEQHAAERRQAEGGVQRAEKGELRGPRAERDDDGGVASARPRRRRCGRAGRLSAGGPAPRFSPQASAAAGQPDTPHRRGRCARRRGR